MAHQYPIKDLVNDQIEIFEKTVLYWKMWHD